MNKKLSLLLLLSVAVPIYADEGVSSQASSLEKLTTASAQVSVQEKQSAPTTRISTSALDQLLQNTPHLSAEAAAQITEARTEQLQNLAWNVVRTALTSGDLAGAFGSCRTSVAESERVALVKYVKDYVYDLLADYARPNLSPDEEAIRETLTNFGQEVNRQGVELIKLDNHNIASRLIADHPYYAAGAAATTAVTGLLVTTLIKNSSVATAQATAKAAARAAAQTAIATATQEATQNLQDAALNAAQAAAGTVGQAVLTALGAK